MSRYLIILILLTISLYAKNEPKSEYVFTEGDGKVETKPNYVIMKIGVSTIHSNPDTALVKTNTTIDTIFSILKKYGTKSNDIETYSASFTREYKDTRDTTTYLGIKSECVLQVNYYNLDSFEILLNQMIGKGMNILKAYDFRHTEEDSLKRIAAQLAFIEASKNAGAIAQKSSRSIGKLLNVSYEKPHEYSVRPDFKIELSRELIGGLMGGYGGGRLDLNLKRQDLKYLRIMIPTLEFENKVYTKFELK